MDQSKVNKGGEKEEEVANTGEIALLVLSSITKKGEIVKNMAPLGHCFVILVIE